MNQEDITLLEKQGYEIKDGKLFNSDKLIAIAIDTAYGYTWAGKYKIDEKDCDFNGLILLGKYESIWNLAKLRKIFIFKKRGMTYEERFQNLEIEWIKEGTAYRIHDYDGQESLVERDEISWKIA